MGAYEVLEHATEHEVAVWGYRVGGGGEIGDPVRVLPAKRARPWAGHVSEGILAMRAGRLADATSLLRAAVERFTPPATEQAVVWLTIGGMHASQAELDKAEAAFENSAAALAAMPGSGTDARSHLPQYALGTLAARRGRFSDAAAAHERALFFCPDFVPSLHALAALQLVRGDFDAAAHYLRIACSHVEAAMKSHALSALRAPPVLDPIPSPPPALAQGQAPLQDSLWRNATSFHDAAAAFLRALPVLSVSGDLWALHMNIGRALQEAGAFEEAMLHLRSAAQLAPPHEAEWLRLYTVLALPVVFDSAEDAAARKAALAGRVADELAEFAKSPDSAAGDPSLLRELYASTHMLPFIGLPHKRLASDIAAAFRRTRRHNLTKAAVARLGTGQAGAVPSGAGLAEGMQRFARVARPSEALQAATVWGGGSLGDSPPRLWGQGVMPRAEAGFERVCGQGHIDGAAPGAAQRNAPCTPVVPGVAAFEPVIVLARPTGDQVTKWCLSHAGGRTARLWVDPGSNSRDGWRTRNLTVAQRALADADLDVLVVLDNAIDPFVAALLQSRSAPVQIAVMGAGSGHLLSPGLADSVDYLVVGDAEAHDTAASGVAEQLVRLGGLGTFFAPMHPVTRGEMFNASARLALFASRNYYVVPRLLPAMHPDFDGALARILAADPDGVIFALFEPLQTLWLEQLRARLLRTLGKEALARVRFVPRMARRQLWAVLTAASVVLDTFPVGMGVLAMECAFVGAPVVALPELQPLRSPSAALMRRLHVAEWLVADSLDDFAAKAVQVATNRSLRGFLRAELLRRSRRLPWPFDPDLGLLSAPLAASSTAPEDQAVFEELLAEDSSTAHAASMALSDAEGTLGDWLQFLGRTGRDPARVRAGGGAADEVVLGPLGLGGGWL
ncbi:hypothetical protein FNF28_03944 [Cafeteria roenbergensis]|uniref:O-GlcNAc transferase C-terminal domain-containing protein n=1 Tax=Cafeteria roenbergensis TaxID=33653 RepID=A0A5A8DFL2_CAFRO|nr:hypothetical protein FNF28_03944 [Cafeteria roenbergensis]